jgi:hypothetical protein
VAATCQFVAQRRKTSVADYWSNLFIVSVSWFLNPFSCSLHARVPRESRHRAQLIYTKAVTKKTVVRPIIV